MVPGHRVGHAVSRGKIFFFVKGDINYIDTYILISPGGQ